MSSWRESGTNARPKRVEYHDNLRTRCMESIDLAPKHLLANVNVVKDHCSRVYRSTLPPKPKVTSPIPGPTPFVVEVASYTDFVFAGITRVNSEFSLPKGTPKFPPVWPFGSVRESLQGWLGSASK